MEKITPPGAAHPGTSIRREPAHYLQKLNLPNPDQAGNPAGVLDGQEGSLRGNRSIDFPRSIKITMEFQIFRRPAGVGSDSGLVNPQPRLLSAGKPVQALCEEKGK